MKTYLFIISILVFLSGNAQQLSDKSSNDSIHSISLTSKSLQQYDSIFKVALSFYPELAHENIKLKFSSINSTARTTISLGSLFKNINKTYFIIINDDQLKTGMLLSDAPIAAQIGLFGHELAHVLDFKKRSFLDLTWWGISYLFDRHRPKIEKRTDKATIKHGLGLPLFMWSDFVLNHSTANEKYLRMKIKNYLSPQEIINYIEHKDFKK